MKTELEYSNILAKLQGNIEGIIINLELKDPNVKSEIKRLKEAVKVSNRLTKKLNNENKRSDKIRHSKSSQNIGFGENLNRLH